MLAAAADALAALLPSAESLTAGPRQRPADGIIPPDEETVSAGLSTAVVASFVGEVSVDLAVVLGDTETILPAAGSEPSQVSLADVLRPALNAAAAELGTGVLGEVRVEDASALFDDEETAIFALSTDGRVAGWFGARLRRNGVVAGAHPISQEAMIGKLGRINNVEMTLTVEIGRTRMAVRDVLALEPGAVIELDRSAGAPADVLLNGRIIAHGEIVVVDQDYAVRITKILDVAEGLV
ncbi:flagellar motor switch protein FliN [Lacisediminihabitans sp.]|uniref:flagellar motor switch protein FliN n=1 Tax=Lacisediminihabitans sp. TaxID=2787631 RepID=UPI0039C95A15